MDVEEATRWTPLAVSSEATIALIVTSALVILVSFWLLHNKLGVHSGHEMTRQVSDALKPEMKKNLDHVSARRQTRSHYQSEIFEILRIVPDKDVAGLKITENYEVNSRGIEIFCKSWLPVTAKPKACVCHCTGYGDTCTYFYEGIARKLASHNFAVFAMDYPGFGLSEGLHGYIQSFDLLVSDVNEHYSSVKEKEEVKGLPVFLMGLSMGGGVALKAHLSMPYAWDGAILVAPMCEVTGIMSMPWFVEQIMKLLASIIPQAQLFPGSDISGLCYRDSERRQVASQNKINYGGKPRLGTILSMLNGARDIEGQLDKVSLPLLILHGDADQVVDSASSQNLYNQASTPDKTLRVYDNAWHALLEGESDETVDNIIEDIARWLDDHSSSQSGE